MIKKSILVSIGLLVVGLLFSSYNSSPSEISSSNQMMTDSSFAEVYPTPFENELFIKGLSENEKEVRIEVFNFSGILVRTIVLEGALSSTPATLNMEGLENEGFVIRVYENNVLISKQRVIKNG